VSDTGISLIDSALRYRIFYKFKDCLSISDFNKDTIFVPKDIALREISEIRGKVEVEFINLWRTSCTFDWKRQRTIVARRGFSLNAGTADSLIQVKAVPASMTYHAYFWSKDFDKINSVLEKYLFWQQDDPNLDMKYNTYYPLAFDLHFGSATDESQITEKYEKGQYFVLNCQIDVDGWVFTNDTVAQIKTIYLRVYDDSVDEDGVLLYSSTTRGKEVIDSANGIETVQQS
jgi:hypothetical protein